MAPGLVMTSTCPMGFRVLVKESENMTACVPGKDKKGNKYKQIGDRN